MFDNILSNKYFVIALFIALCVVIYLYYRKKSCDVESMDLIPLSPEVSERPWLKEETYKPKKVNGLKRLDEIYHKHMQDSGFLDVMPGDDTNKKIKVLRKKNNRPSIKEYQPCICPQLDVSDEFDEDDYIIYNKRGEKKAYDYLYVKKDKFPSIKE